MNMIIEEEVLVPDIPIIEEQVLYPDNPISVEEEVLVPILSQQVQRKYELDPLWDSLENTPKNHIQMIVYKGKDKDQDVSFWFHDQNINVNWGDGIIEDINNNKAGYNRVNHKFADGTGKLDSNGERFWFVDVTITKDNNVYNDFVLSNYVNSNDFSKSIIKAVSINREGLYTNLKCADNSRFYPPYIEYVRIHGKHIPNVNDTVSSVFIREIKFDDGEISFDKVIGNTFPKNYPGYPIDIFNYKLIKVYSNAIFANIYSPIILKKCYDLRPWVFSSISNLFEGNNNVEEIYLPEKCDKNWESLGYMVNGCYRLKKLVFPEDQTLFSYINDLTASFGDLYNLEEVINFPNEHIGEFANKAIVCTAFNYFLYSMGFGNDKIKLRCFIANNSYIYSLKFNNESPFDYGSVHINLKEAKFEKDNLISLFNILPDFSTSTSRTINIIENPGTSELSEQDLLVATNKNWVVITK